MSYRTPANKDGKKYVFEPQAYAKAIMHGCKHSSDVVTGVLIGSVSNAKVMKVVDVIPLFHTHALGPMLKIAFLLIEQYCRTDDRGLEILGLYFAHPDGNSDANYPPVKAVAEKILSNCPQATVWSMDLSKLPDNKFAMGGYCHPRE